MQARAAGAVSVRLLEQPRTLVASGEAVWIWPGIALTTRRGVEIVPVTDATIRFWVSRPHGPEAHSYRNLTRAVAQRRTVSHGRGTRPARSGRSMRSS